MTSAEFPPIKLCSLRYEEKVNIVNFDILLRVLVRFPPIIVIRLIHTKFLRGLQQLPSYCSPRSYFNILGLGEKLRPSKPSLCCSHFNLRVNLDTTRGFKWHQGCKSYCSGRYRIFYAKPPRLMLGLWFFLKGWVPQLAST